MSISPEEVYETVSMTLHHNLDIRTVTLGINLKDCIDSSPPKFIENVYVKITDNASRLVEEAEAPGGAPVLPHEFDHELGVVGRGVVAAHGEDDVAVGAVRLRAVWQYAVVALTRQQIATCSADLVGGDRPGTALNHVAEVAHPDAPVVGRAVRAEDGGAVVGDDVEITIENYGVGLLFEEREAILRRGTKGRLKDPIRHIPGTGMGLYIADEVIREHGGNIDVWCELFGRNDLEGAIPDDKEDYIERGSLVRFTVSLPLQRG